MKMLICTDGSESSQKAIKEAVSVAANYEDIEITIITVYETSQLPMYDSEGGSMSAEMQAKFEESMREKGERILQEAVKIFEEKDLRPDSILIKGHPSTEIIKVASEGNYDLIVLGSRGLSGLKKILLGSVSNAVAQEAESNILIVKQ